MKLIFTLAFLLHVSFSFSQWTRVQQLPPLNILSLYHTGNTLYAGGKNIVYFSTDGGQNWDSTNRIPQLNLVDNLIVFKNELYAAAYGLGVYKSRDGGNTWQSILPGIVPFISDFFEWNDNLYASTFGNSIFKLNPVNRNTWLPFSNGLSNFSANVTSLSGTSNTLIGGGLANGMYNYLAPGTEVWQERFLTGQISPSEGTDDIATSNDSLYLAGSSGKFYLSTDHGFTWTIFGNRLVADYNLILNAKQAILAARNIFDGQNFNTGFYYIKKDSLDKNFVPFSFLPGRLTYRMEIFDNKLWATGTGGLFYMSLSDLPGISAAGDPPTVIILPLRFISFDVQLKADNTVAVQWKTADEVNIDHFEVERSANGATWNKLSNAGLQASHEYSYNDLSPRQGINYYRVKAVGIDGQVFYTIIKPVIIENETKFAVFPNPVSDVVFINITNNRESQATIRVFDNRGALVKTQTAALNAGINQLRVEVASLATGVYTLSAEWNNGKTKKVVRVLKQ